MLSRYVCLQLPADIFYTSIPSRCTTAPSCVQPLVTGWWWHRLSTYGRRAFAVAGPMTFNALPDELRDPTVNTTTCRRFL